MSDYFATQTESSLKVFIYTLIELPNNECYYLLQGRAIEERDLRCGQG